MRYVLKLGFIMTAFSILFLISSAAQVLDITYHEIDVDISPSEHLLRASDKITIEVGKAGSYTLLLGNQFEMIRIVLNGKKIDLHEVTGEELNKFLDEAGGNGKVENIKGFKIDLKREGEHVLEVLYQGIVYDTLKVPEYSRGVIPEETSGIISEDGIYLSGSTHWYPDVPDDYAFFTINATTPPDFISITEGKRISTAQEKNASRSTWEVLYPTRAITLVAGKYLVHEEEMEGITVMACFFPSEKDLIPRYIQFTKRYLEMYNRLIGPYPFSKFAVVENFFPTGYGMPSYTLLGRRVIRLPFIVYTSLGHEVAHNWWGNSVYPDYSKGNWCEGLTLYFADHRYKEAVSDSAAADYRRVLNTDYTSYVHEDNDFPLAKFEERTTPATRSVGYGKCALVFHMLKKVVGEETFYRALRTFYEKFQFKKASWEDIEDVFEKASGRDLAFFFEQWVKQMGAASLLLEHAEVDSSGSGYEVKVHLKQDPVYRLLVPLSIVGADSSAKPSVWLTSPESTFAFTCEYRPLSLHVDPDYDLFRRLDPFEIPPTISSVLGDKSVLIVLPSRATAKMRSSYTALVDQLNRTGESTVKEDTSVTVIDVEKRSLLILGNSRENLLLSVMKIPSGIELEQGRITVAGSSYSQPGHGAYVTFRSPFNPIKSVSVVLGNSAEAVENSGYKIIHYGKYSFVTFLEGKRIEAGILPVMDNPMVVTFE